jgi:hypothetical protein
MWLHFRSTEDVAREEDDTVTLEDLVDAVVAVSRRADESASVNFEDDDTFFVLLDFALLITFALDPLEEDATIVDEVASVDDVVEGRT